MPLTSKQRSALKALAHHIKPVVSVGVKGMTDAVIAETDRALAAHELIKVRFHEAKALEEGVPDLAARVSADIVAVRGKNAILFRQDPDDAKIRLPR